jgi:hypothetical protein
MRAFNEDKTGQTKEDIDLSCLVPGTGIEPALPCDNQILSPPGFLFRLNRALSVFANLLVFN